MKKKLSKQKRRLFATIAASLLALSIVVFSVFTVIMYNAEKDKLFSGTSSNMYEISRTVRESYSSPNNYGYKEFMLNSLLTSMWYNEGNENFYVIDSEGTTIIDSRNTISVNFEDTERIQVYGSIYKDAFRKSMTDEQYNKINDYLNREPLDSGEYYDLVCTEYYLNDYDIIPATVEIVLTEDDNDWYAQDTVIETFNLSPVIPSSVIYCKSYDGCRNTIDAEWIFNKEDIFAEFDRYKENITERHYLDKIPFFYTEPFTYIYYTNDYITTDFEYDEFGDTVTTSHCTIYYVQKINVLESCFNTILMMLIYTFIVFVIVGIIISAILWRTLKKQIIQENKLRTVTNAMAHELKTPLFIIGGYSENLAENINNDKRVHYAKVIAEQTVSMNELVSKMLDYSKLDSASFNLNLEKFNIAELASEILEGYMIYKINLECKNDVYIKADKRLIKCVVENLIDNAIKYTTDINDVTVTVTDKSFAVSNPCPPMLKDDIDKMWQPYHRDTEHNEINGHGLGLAIVKNILELHKFKHNASYSNNKITFKFYF